MLHANPFNWHVSTVDVKQSKPILNYSLRWEPGTNFALSEDSVDEDMDQSKSTRWAHGKSLILPCQTENHICSGSGSLVSGLFFLEASNPGGSLAWRHRALPPSPCLLMCCTHTLISSAAHKHKSQLWAFWLLTSGYLIKPDCLIRFLIRPAEGVTLWRKVLSEYVGCCVGIRQPAKLSLLPAFSLPHFPGCMSELLRSLYEMHHVTRKRGSPPFPLLTERKYCNRGGRRWALLRSRLKITGIFKSAEESQGRQRLDSLPPGRSSLLLLSQFLAGFSLSASACKPIWLYTSPAT